VCASSFGVLFAILRNFVFLLSKAFRPRWLASSPSKEPLKTPLKLIQIQD
jgi:hypothetical protein